MAETVRTFCVKCEPKPQPRPRAARVGKGIRVYTPNTAATFRTMAGIAAWEAFKDGELPIDGGVHIKTVFFLRRPKRLKGEAVIHTVKPDLDNLDKSLRDGLQQSGVFSDDCIIWSATSEKYYADEGESPRAEVTVTFDKESD